MTYFEILNSLMKLSPNLLNLEAVAFEQDGRTRTFAALVLPDNEEDESLAFILDEIMKEEDEISIGKNEEGIIDGDFDP